MMTCRFTRVSAPVTRHGSRARNAKITPFIWLFVASASAVACGGGRLRDEPARASHATAPVVPAAAPPTGDTEGWLKGQLHLHSSASGDSDTPPADVVRWYAARDYDFIVFTDHNRITEVDGTEHMLVLPGVELTANLEACAPPPEPGLECLLHINALAVDPSLAPRIRELPPPSGLDRLEHYDHARRVSEALGGLAMLNHPNFHYAADAALVAALAERGPVLLEVANEAVDSNNAGDADHPSTERLWDEVLAGGHRVWGTATDDAHHYEDAEAVRARGELAHVGDRGFVMVRAEREPTAIREALRRGDFYASSGVLLARIEADTHAAEVEVAAGQGPVQIVASTVAGLQVARGGGPVLRIAMKDVPGPFVRFTVTDADGRKAWTQPAWR